MRTAVACTAFVGALVAACATPPIAPGVPREVSRVIVAPYQSYDECVRLARGDRLDWRFESSEPLGFDIHYREGNAVLSPIVRDPSTMQSGTFEAQIGQVYCLTWEAGPPGAILAYRVLLRVASR